MLDDQEGVGVGEEEGAGEGTACTNMTEEVVGTSKVQRGVRKMESARSAEEEVDVLGVVSGSQTADSRTRPVAIDSNNQSHRGDNHH